MDEKIIHSNISIASNIYVRTNPILDKDPNFVKQVSGRNALLKTKELLSGFSSTALSKGQRDEIELSTNCAYSKNNEKSWGPLLVNGILKWVCRCETTDCKYYDDCMKNAHSKRIVRSIVDEIEPEITNEKNEINLFDENKFNIDELFEKKINSIKENIPVVEESPVEPVEEVTMDFSSNYTQIENPTTIIQSPIDEKIIVNAGPGTGKTYTVIKRIEYILNNNLVKNASNILLLCYSNSAKKVIYDRLEQSVLDLSIPSEAMQVSIMSFDSLATQYLFSINENISMLSYDERISLFNNKIDEESFSDYEYLIIDELQDLVNDRAEMTLTILNKVNCAYLLLGDKCQAIYDYECTEQKQNSINSVEFYDRLENSLPRNVVKYELTKNMRQCSNLATFTMDMRDALLHFTPKECNHLIKDEIEKITKIPEKINKFIPTVKNDEKIAILCRNNGEAEIISSMLYQKGIAHNFIRSSDKLSYNRVLADLLWDHCDDYIVKDDFIERYVARIDDNSEQAEKLFELLWEFIDSEMQDKTMPISKAKLIQSLQNNVDIIEEIMNVRNSSITVSTIHRAKGKEFDNVYILYDDFNENSSSTEESRIWYVATTRAKKDVALLYKKDNWYVDHTNNGRWFKKGRKIPSKFVFCSQIAVGLDDDVNKNSFVCDSFENVLEMQEYIATNVNQYDKIELRLENEQYNIYHGENNKCIGRLSENAKDDIEKAVLINKFSKLPNKLYNLYISNVVTMVMTNFSDEMPLHFRTSKIWYGIEIAGFAKIDWHYGE